MNTDPIPTVEILTAIAQTLSAIAQTLSAIAQILPYTALPAAARRLPQTITWLIKATKALHRLLTTPRGRHRQGRGRHTK